jgi:hypothetical protein
VIMTISLVAGQTATGSTASGTSFTITLTNNPATNNLVVVSVGFGVSTITAISVKDSNSNVFTATTSTPFALGGGDRIGVYYLIAPANATKTLTVAWTTTSDGGGCAAEFTGTAISTVFERDNTATGVTPLTTPSITTTNSGDLIYEAGGDGSSSGLLSAGGSYTNIGAITDGQFRGAFQVQSAAGAISASWTAAGSTDMGAILAAFKAAPAAGGTPLVISLMDM